MSDLKVTITVTRGKDAKTYQLDESGESKKGNFKTFSPPGETPDLPDFSKVYVKVKRSKANGKAK